MWKPDERFFVRSHVASSVATFVCGLIVVLICLVPSFFPGIYRLLVDERIVGIVPYLLFMALGSSVFSIWYFIFRKRK